MKNLTNVEVGDRSPDFTLRNIGGERVSLGDMIGEGNLVLVFYRGDWCPYCKAQLSALTHHYGEFQELGAKIAAISVDGIEKNKLLSERLKLPFTILSDSDRNVMELFGVVDEEHGIAKPATFIVDRNGVIRYKYIGKHYADRPDHNEQLEVLMGIRRVGTKIEESIP